MDDEARFSGIRRLYGNVGYERIRSAHVCVIGVGGVGSWAVEALARSGVGQLTLIDADDVCLSNVNRQIHALDGTIGQSKVDAMATRIRAIHPTCEVHCVQRFVTAKNVAQRITDSMDYVFDAIDSVSDKCAIIDHCKRNAIACIVAGGAGGRTDPTQVQVKDLSRSFNDPLLLKVRKKLRRDYAFTRNKKKKFKIDCVFSPEAIVYPWADGSVCAEREAGSELGLNCDAGFGTATYLTGAFGFAAAAHIIRQIAAGNFPQPAPQIQPDQALEAQPPLDTPTPD